MTEAQIAGQATKPTTARRRRTTAKPADVSVSAPEEKAVGVVADARPHVHHVHFLEDGVTALDRVFVRGEEVEVKPGTPWFEMAHDAEGNCVFAIDRVSQIRRFGKHLWDEGPWPFDPYDLQARLDNGEELTAEEQAILEKANADRFKRQPVGAPPKAARR